MVALHVLGNGFDLQHDLPTAYAPHLKKIAVEAERFHGEWECYSDAEDLWSDVEANLAHPDMDMLLQHLESYAPDLLSEREGDRDGIIHEAEQLLDFPLEEFARRADEALEEQKPLGIFQKIFGPRDCFLNFNYTHTLERLYEIDPSRVLHVHGEVGGEPLILGYAPGALRDLPELHEWDDEESFDYYRSIAHGALEKRLKEFEKTYQVERMSEFLTRVPRHFDRVVVYGFSFGLVDKPYFDRLAELLEDVPWMVYAYDRSALEDACSRLDEYGCGITYQKQVLEEKSSQRTSRPTATTG
ncbi:MAG: hypothetical protein BGN97_09895 [Microbacterium sp. 69-10]|uniref:bacteriophage abortive infection AbiH family protein n=1 Tax=Microbacterium sp. 69-10 TaxID=1895783 RepID=UPI00095BE1FF|nr:bacteriophage abortive infection AbiH family protein [Microbacterium sp. 69-10]OJU41479.1 MAG: hypothetical protein BGN97_09895 [Microbacterium sp. 69-10]